MQYQFMNRRRSDNPASSIGAGFFVWVRRPGSALPKASTHNARPDLGYGTVAYDCLFSASSCFAHQPSIIPDISSLKAAM